MHDDHEIPIWFFIGSLLSVYGVLVLGSGIYGWVHPPAQKLALWELHADVWWGILLLVVGLIYVAKYRPSKTAKRGQ
jgi:hypothetical protein